MKNKALYFIPDISGFTKFVTSTEIEHSRHIISELLELVIDANIMGLKLVEIEGDALFMYTTDDHSIEKIIEQSKKMLNDFHNHLNLYNTQRICNCGACSTAAELKLKFIAHVGELSFIRVKHIVKPYGEDIIKTHRFLKNSIPSNQYLLISKETIDYYNYKFDTKSLFEKKEDDYDFGKSTYYYLTFDQFKEDELVTEQRLLHKPKGEPQISLEVKIPANTKLVYKYISDLNLRKSWNKFIKRLDYDEHRVNRIGTKHDCIVGSNTLKVETIGLKNMKDDTMVYGEKTGNAPFLNSNIHFIYLNKINKDSTNLKLEIFLTFTFFGKFMKFLLKKYLLSLWEKSLNNLKLELRKLEQSPF